MSESEVPATRLIQQLRAGDAEAAEKLLPLIYDELHRLAQLSFQGQPENHTLQPTALVNEAWIRMIGGKPGEWKDRVHFMRVAATAMRHVLVDHARGKGRVKRGQRAAVSAESLDQLMGVFEQRSIDVLSLHEGLGKLSAFDERMARVVELRFFGGLSVPEVAEVLEVSVGTVERVWRLARAWLRREIPEPGT